jgi:hypothetical protein
MADYSLLFKSAGIGSLLNVSAGQTYLTSYGVLYGTGATNLVNATAFGATGTVLVGGGSSAAPSFLSLPGNTLVLKAPTVQKFTSGSGTYTTPTNPVPLYLRVKLVGGGGGGGGSATVVGGNGGTGGNGATTSFSVLIANPGLGAAGVVVGAGGGATVGTAIGIAVGGATGQGSGQSSTAATDMAGGMGGGSALGGAGSGQNAASGAAGAAVTNSGSGGGGGGAPSAGQSGAGGGAGGYVDAILNFPGATFAYVVGGGGGSGAAGTGGATGGIGAAGIIIVEELYQ